MKTCSKCQCEFEDRFKFCPECGSSSGVSSESLAGFSMGAQRTMENLSEKAQAVQDDRSMGDDQTMINKPAEVKGAFQGTTESVDDRYEILEEIGRGGFARVWRARDRKLDRIVALKRLMPESLSGSEGARTLERFRREANAIASLNHRNIVGVYDRGEDAKGPYIVMEYVGGGSLKDLLRRQKKLEVVTAVKLAIGIARGLDHAHRKNLVHRDIKPANILLSREGDEWVPKIADFGLARGGGGDTGLSMSGYGMGTQAYMSPEQRRDAKSVNQTADLYALGKTLYEMAAGLAPDDVDLEKLPPALAEVVKRCIKPSPEERYFSAAEMLADLERVGTGGGVNAGSIAVKVQAEINACPACGMPNATDVKFCEGCGTGLTRNCPECGRENSVNKQFCGGCGTDTVGFFVVQEAVVRIKKYTEERYWSRIQKEIRSLNRDIRLNGEKGKELLRMIDSFSDEATRMLRERDCLYAAITKAVADNNSMEEALRNIARYKEVDPHKDWTDEIKELEKRVSERNYAEASRTAKRVADNKAFVDAAGIWKKYLENNPKSDFLEEVRASILRLEVQAKEAEDDKEFEKTKSAYSKFLNIRDFRAAEKVCVSYIEKFTRHTKEMETLKKRAIDLYEDQRQQQQIQLERKLKQFKSGFVFGIIILVSVFGGISLLSLWRIYVFESSVSQKDLQACLNSSKRLICYYPSHKAQAKIGVVENFLNNKAHFYNFWRDNKNLLDKHGGQDWLVVKKMVDDADKSKDLTAGSRIYEECTERIKRILAQAQAYQKARTSYERLVSNKDIDLERFGGSVWADVKKTVATAEGSFEPLQGIELYDQASNLAGQIISNCDDAIAARKQWMKHRETFNTAEFKKYASQEWQKVESLQKRAEDEADPLKAISIYKVMIVESDMARAVINSRKEAEATMLKAYINYIQSVKLIDEGLARKHVADEWRGIQERASKAFKDRSDVSLLEACYATYVSAAHAVDILRKRLDAMILAKRQFEKKQSLFADEKDEIARLASAEWQAYIVFSSQANEDASPEALSNFFQESSSLLEKAVKAADAARRNVTK